jgi:hypothetical protein
LVTSSFGLFYQAIHNKPDNKSLKRQSRDGQILFKESHLGKHKIGSRRVRREAEVFFILSYCPWLHYN